MQLHSFALPLMWGIKALMCDFANNNFKLPRKLTPEDIEIDGVSRVWDIDSSNLYHAALYLEDEGMEVKVSGYDPSTCWGIEFAIAEFEYRGDLQSTDPEPHENTHPREYLQSKLKTFPVEYIFQGSPLNPVYREKISHRVKYKVPDLPKKKELNLFDQITIIRLPVVETWLVFGYSAKIGRWSLLGVPPTDWEESLVKLTLLGIPELHPYYWSNPESELNQE